MLILPKFFFEIKQKNVTSHPQIEKARMAELVDALVSGTSVRKDVQVRVLFRVQKKLL